MKEANQSYIGTYKLMVEKEALFRFCACFYGKDADADISCPMLAEKTKLHNDNTFEIFGMQAYPGQIGIKSDMEFDKIDTLEWDVDLWEALLAAKYVVRLDDAVMICGRCGQPGDHAGMQYYPMEGECRWI